jgi:SAM-dependent methyltransferase
MITMDVPKNLATTKAFRFVQMAWKHRSQSSKLIAALRQFAAYGYIHTGERVNPDIPNQNFINHFRVYKFAAQFCGSETTLLDIGCGMAYGTQYLAERAKYACGIDISAAALRFARRRYGRTTSNLKFQQADAHRLPFGEKQFDFIISVENFEHLADQIKAAKEMARVLKPDGLCLVETPDGEACRSNPNNPYHTRECTFEELEQIFGPSFQGLAIIDSMASNHRDRGIRPETSPLVVFGRKVNTEHLSNPDSFFCFLNGPRV